MIDRFDHLEIVASDAEETVRFLTQIGFVEKRSTEHHGSSYELTLEDEASPVFEVHTVEGEEMPGINHLAFAVRDLEEFIEELRSEGYEVEDAQHFESTGRTLTNVRGPDGHRYQFVAIDE